MGDKSPKNTNKTKKQQDAKKHAGAAAKNAASEAKAKRPA